MTSPETEPFAKGPVTQKIKNAAQTVGTTLKNTGQQVKNKVNEFATGWDIGNEVSNDTNGLKSTYLDKKRDSQKGDDGDSRAEAAGYGINMAANKTADNTGKVINRAGEAIKHPPETREQADKPGTSHFENPNTGKKETQAMQTALDPNLKDKDSRSVLGDRERRETSEGQFTTLYTTGGAGKKTITALGKVPNEPKQGAGKALDLLNMGADLSTAVERGLKTMRSTVNVAMSPQMTGANVGAAFVSHVTGLLDATSQSLSEIGKDMDASVKRRTAEYGQRMKAQFAYMLDRICTDASGKKKTLDQLDADDIGRLYDSMHNVWGREAEAVTKGLSPELAAGVKKAYGKALTDLGRYASEAKARTVTAKQEAKLVRDKKVSDTKERTEQDITQHFDSLPDDNPYKLHYQTLTDSGLDPISAAETVTGDMNKAVNATRRFVETRVPQMEAQIKGLRSNLLDPKTEAQYRSNVASAQANNNGSLPWQQVNALELHDKSKARIDELEKKIDIYKKTVEAGPKLQQGYNTDWRQRSYTGVGEAVAERLFGNRDVFNSDEHPLERGITEAVMSKPGDIHNVERCMKNGLNLMDIITHKLRGAAQSKIIKHLQDTVTDHVMTVLGDDKYKDMRATAIWEANNRKSLDKLEEVYNNLNKKNGVIQEYARGSGGVYTQEFMDWLNDSLNDTVNGTKTYYDKNGIPVAQIYMPKDYVGQDILMHPGAMGLFNAAYMRSLRERGHDKKDVSPEEWALQKALWMQSSIESSKMEQSFINSLKQQSYTTKITIQGKEALETWKKFLGRDVEVVGTGKTPDTFTLSVNVTGAMLEQLDRLRNQNGLNCWDRGENAFADWQTSVPDTMKKILIKGIANDYGLPSPYADDLYVNGPHVEYRSTDTVTMGDMANINSVAANKALRQSASQLTAMRDIKNWLITNGNIKNAVIPGRDWNNIDIDDLKQIDRINIHLSAFDIYVYYNGLTKRDLTDKNKLGGILGIAEKITKNKSMITPQNKDNVKKILDKVNSILDSAGNNFTNDNMYKNKKQIITDALKVVQNTS